MSSVPGNFPVTPVVFFLPAARVEAVSGLRGLWKVTRASGGNASLEDPPRTSLGKGNGPERGTRPKEVTWKS